MNESGTKEILRGQVVIFCQAAGDIKYSLSLYEKHKADCDVIVYLPPNQPCSHFVKSLLGDAAVILPPPPVFSLKRVWRVSQIKRVCRNVYNTHFRRTEGARVYFFSKEFDWYSVSFISRLAKQGCRVILCEHYSHNPRPVLSFGIKDWIILKLHCVMSGVAFVYCRLGEHKNRYQRVLQWNMVGVDAEVSNATCDVGIFEKYSYPVPNAEQKVLWIDAPDIGDVLNYEVVTRNILSELFAAGISVIVKPHPRLAVHSLYGDYELDIISEQIPGEFLPITAFRGILGSYSSLLGSAGRQVPAMSLLNLYEWRDPGAKIYAEVLVDKASDGRVIYVNSISEVVSRLLA